MGGPTGTRTLDRWIKKPSDIDESAKDPGDSLGSDPQSQANGQTRGQTEDQSRDPREALLIAGKTHGVEEFDLEAFLAGLPVDSEPLSAEQLRALQEGRAEFVSGKTTPMKEILDEDAAEGIVPTPDQ